MLKVVSYYVKSETGTHFTFWEDGIAKALLSLLGGCTFCPVKGDFRVADDNFDLAYCQPSLFPDRRPARFVFSFLSDYRGHERRIANWIDRVKPDFLFCLQQKPDALVEYGKNRGCRVEFLPWFVFEFPQLEKKSIEIMCSGCVDPFVYPSRRKIFNYLSQPCFQQRAVLSCSADFGRYPLGNDDYRKLIVKTRYYASGGIYDQWIPPKYYEVMNYGACLLSFSMPYMKECGFVDGETYIELKSIDEIATIINSDRYLQIGISGQKMVRQLHSAQARAKKIRELYDEFVGSRA